MAFSSFSGPLRSGTVLIGPGRNAGLVELVQTFTIPTAAILTAPAALTAFVLPGGSRIMDFGADVIVALATATNCGITFGISGGSATQYMTSVNTGATVGRVAKATIDTASQVANFALPATDTTITVTPTAATGNASAGSIVVWVRYLQRAADGSANPASA